MVNSVAVMALLHENVTVLSIFSLLLDNIRITDWELHTRLRFNGSFHIIICLPANTQIYRNIIKNNRHSIQTIVEFLILKNYWKDTNDENAREFLNRERLRAALMTLTLRTHLKHT